MINVQLLKAIIEYEMDLEVVVDTHGGVYSVEGIAGDSDEWRLRIKLGNKVSGATDNVD